MKIAVFTIASKNYLAYVRTLMSSIARIQPEYNLFLCLADRVDAYFDTVTEPYYIVEANQLNIPYFNDMTLRYDIMEFNTAVKPFMFRWLFDNYDFDAVIYLDPDVKVYSRFEHLESLLENGRSIVLTPHITKPIEDRKAPNDYHMLQSGVFNLGFIAARRCSETLEFMHWWGRKLSTQCEANFSENLFVDQRWCDLAPCFLDNLKILKEPGYNVAYWNLAQRKIDFEPNSGWMVNSSPLVFFHFSGINVEKKQLVSKHQNRFDWDDIKAYQTLFLNYLDELIANGWEISNKWPYAYDFASNSFSISALIRHLYQQIHPEPVDINNIEDYLVSICNQRDEAIADEGGAWISKLMGLVYQSRPDLQKAFNLATLDGRQKFSNWFEISGEREYGFSPRVVCQDFIMGKSHSHYCSKKKY